MRSLAFVRSTSIIFLLLLVATILPTNALPDTVASASIQRQHGLQTQIEVTLTAPQNPVLGQPMALKITVTPLLDAPEVRLRWELPPGVTLLDGPAQESLGAMTANQTLVIDRQVRFDSPGTHRIGVEGSYHLPPALTYGDAALLFFTVDESGGSVAQKDPNAAARLRERIPLSPNASFTPRDEAQTSSGNATDADCVNIFGIAKRMDKVFDGTSVTINEIPVTGALIEIWEDDLIFDDHYGTIMPTALGEFGWTSCADDGLFDGDLEYYVKVVAAAEGTIDERIATVRHDPWFWIDLPDIPFLDDGTWAFDTENKNSSGPGNLDFDTIILNEEMSSVINITEGMYQAWRHWQDHDGDENRIEYDEVDVYWSPGDSFGTYYVGLLDNLYIQGEHDDPDEWDDSVIIHEWGHFADDKWGCDKNPGGDHGGTDIVDPELAWGEGYPDFYQSVVRSANGEPRSDFYLDRNGMDGCGVCLDLERWDINHPGSRSENNEMSIAASLWDLIDGVNDGQDMFVLPEGYTMIEKFYLDPGWVEANAKDCTFGQYLYIWAFGGGPTDAAVAAIITQNSNLAQPFPTTATTSAANAPTSGAVVAAIPLASEQDYRWWDRVTYVVDNSLSMAGVRLDAVKTVLQEQVDDLFAGFPQGVELRLDTFNNTSATNQPIFAGQFYPDHIKPAIAALTNTTASDGGTCPVDAFGALKQSVAGESNMSAWLFTDSNPAATLSPLENFRAELVQNDINASFAILQAAGGGSCLGGGFPPPALITRQKQLQRQWLFNAGPAPTEPSNSIVPYLLTAQATGGQFLFVEEGKMEFAAEILQAQLSHNAGAGRWSDYVSLQSTYRYDQIPSWEYDWFETTTAQPFKPGSTGSEGFIDVPVPVPFAYYSRTVTTAHVYENGYVTFDGEAGEEVLSSVGLLNTPLPNAAAPNGALYPYWDDLEWDMILLAAEPNAPEQNYGTIYTGQDGERFAITYDQYASPASGGFVEIFQVVLNASNGEILFQYDNVASGVPSATIGLEGWSDLNPINGVQVSFNDTNAASSDMGYRFTPVPPQPSKSYSVTVDATMQSIGFLLTGFSGTLAPISIRTPDNTLIACGTAGVVCVEVGMVQYVQVNVENRTGLWKVDVTPGASGSGTFSFSSMAAGPIPVDNPNDHSLPSFQSTVLVLDMGQPLDNNQLTGFFQSPANQGFGAPFILHDDGQHGDGQAEDGRFGSDPVMPAGAGSAYLWVDGAMDGQPIRRVEDKLYTFQPLHLEGPDAAAAFAAKTVVSFTLTNADSVAHTFNIDLQVPDGWRGELEPPGDGTIAVGAGLSQTFAVAIWMGPTDQDSLDQPSGATGIVNVAAIEAEQGLLNDSAAVQITRHRLPASIIAYDGYPFVQKNTTVPLNFTVVDTQTVPVADGTTIFLQTTLGSLPASATTQNGLAIVDFAAGPQTGVAHITASADNGFSVQSTNDISATLILSITQPLAEHIELSTTVSALPADGASTATLIATVRDEYGTPLPDHQVRIGVGGGGDQAEDISPYGSVNGGQVVSGTTNTSGEFRVTFTSGTAFGIAEVRAELFALNEMVGEARREIIIGALPGLFLPTIRNQPNN